jgi:hypothetical protein
MSRSFADKVMEKFPELMNLLTEDESTSDLILASLMLSKMVLGEKFNTEVIGWAAEVSLDFSFKNKDSEHAKTLPKLLIQLGSEEAVANFVADNAAKVYAAQQKAYVLAYFVKLRQR